MSAEHFDVDAFASTMHAYGNDRLVTVELPEPEREENGRVFFPGCVVAFGHVFVQVAGQTMGDADEVEAKAASMLAAARILREGS